MITYVNMNTMFIQKTNVFQKEKEKRKFRIYEKY